MLGASLFLHIDLHLKVIEANIAHVTVDIAQAAADMVVEEAKIYFPKWSFFNSQLNFKFFGIFNGDFCFLKKNYFIFSTSSLLETVA